MSDYGEITALRRLCMERGMSRRQLAIKAGLALQTVYSTDSGQVPSGQTVQKLADALEMTPAELVAVLFPLPEAATA